MSTFDFIVVGRGLMGTACARHLAEAGHKVAVVGPDEPTDRQTHNAPFASHHDAGRITRHVSHDPMWSELSAASIARYRDLEARSGIPFFHEVGALMAGRYTPAMTAFTSGLERMAEQYKATRMTPDEVAARFPYRLPQDAIVSYEATGGGWIDPRALRRAEEVLAIAAGARAIPLAATNLTGQTVTLSDGTQITAPQIVWATGGYARTQGILPRTPDMRVYARTIAFAETKGPHPDMPTLIWVPDGLDDDLYMLPPIQYPDGRWLMKIGGEVDSPLLTTDAEMTEWFRSAGRAEAGQRLLGHLRDVLPDMEWGATHTEPCAVTFTATGYPYIDRMTDGLTILTGGNGAGAKCCDELGRLGAVVAQGGSAPGFEAVYL